MNLDKKCFRFFKVSTGLMLFIVSVNLRSEELELVYPDAIKGILNAHGNAKEQFNIDTSPVVSNDDRCKKLESIQNRLREFEGQRNLLETYILRYNEKIKQTELHFSEYINKKNNILHEREHLILDYTMLMEAERDAKIEVGGLKSILQLLVKITPLEAHDPIKEFIRVYVSSQREQKNLLLIDLDSKIAQEVDQIKKEILVDLKNALVVYGSELNADLINSENLVVDKNLPLPSLIFNKILKANSLKDESIVTLKGFVEEKLVTETSNLTLASDKLDAFKSENKLDIETLEQLSFVLEGDQRKIKSYTLHVGDLKKHILENIDSQYLALKEREKQLLAPPAAPLPVNVVGVCLIER